MLVLIVVLFCYLLVSKTYLDIRVAVVTETGDIMWMEEYYKFHTNQPFFLQDEFLSRYGEYDGNYTILNMSGE